MKKSLIALAIASAVSAPAFAATSNVDVYGIMSFSVDHIDTNEAGDSKDLNTGKDNASRIGFKGSEDLGGGLKAIWQVEMQLNANNDDGISVSTAPVVTGITSTGTGVVTNVGTNGTGLVTTVGNGYAVTGVYAINGNAVTSVSATGNMAYRNTFVGLSSDTLGTVILGRHDTPYKMATSALDPFADTIGDYNAIVGQTNAGGNLFDLRVSGTVAYVSPSFSGLSFAAAYVQPKLNEGANVDEASAWSANGSYANGPLFASLAYEEHSGTVAGSSATQTISAWKAGLGYTFGNTKLGLVYESIEHDAASMDASRDAWYGSVSHTMGAIVLKGAYGQADDGEAAGNTGAKFYAVGGDYMLSKRSSIYAVYADVNNDSAATYNMGGYSNTGAGLDTTGFSLGIKHSF